MTQKSNNDPFWFIFFFQTFEDVSDGFFFEFDHFTDVYKISIALVFANLHFINLDFGFFGDDIFFIRL